ncbi:MAG: uracil-DNA glycosylase, partial [bacterium]
MTSHRWLDRAGAYLRQLEEGEGPLVPAPRMEERSPEHRETAAEDTGSLSPERALPPDTPWEGEPPRPEVDTVGIPESLICSVPEGAPERAELLARFHRQIGTCLKCPLGETRTHFVFGTGAPDADIMFIGEAPGAEEDARGEPFVGRAGKLLDRIIEAMGFEREEVFIANILKCRPPNNRDPQALEVEACEPYLRRQIALIRPAVICALGRVAGQTLL